ncbi:MAG: M13 family peptidase, partial [Chitinophagaceae bacterium]
MNRIFRISLALMIVNGCSEPVEKASTHAAITGIDSTKKPGDNFFMYVNSTWYDSAQIPASQSGVGSYSFLNFPQRIRLQGILDSVSKAKNAEGSLEQKVGDFYASGMDTATINKRGYDPIKPILAKIDAITDVPSLLKVVIDETKSDNSGILGFSVGPDDKQSTVNIVQFYQAGIGLPERDYYFKTDDNTATVQKAYKQFLTELFVLMGADSTTAGKNASIAYEIEKQFATSHRTNIELRDVKANYNKLAVADLSKKHPILGWVSLLEGLGAKVDSVNIAQPGYYDKLNSMLKSVPLSDWKIYLKSEVAMHYSNLLSQPFADASFAYEKTLSGQSSKKPRAEEMT